MNQKNFRIFHISDLHERGARENESWRRRRVLGDAWKRNLEEITADGNPDIVCFTGDVADWGRRDEYAKVTEFLQELMKTFDLPMTRLFVVPGNHDIQRNVNTQLWEEFRAGILSENRQEVSRWMAGGKAPKGFCEIHREKVLMRQSEYRNWIENELGLTHMVGGGGKHQNLGWHCVVPMSDVAGGAERNKHADVHVIGLDSAWLAGDDNDAGKLLLTSDQVMKLVSDECGNSLTGFRIALIHHPLEDLADGSECRKLLSKHVDLLLRGHLHESESCVWSDPEFNLRQVATGCLYEGYRADQYSNTCTMLDIKLSRDGRPQHCELHFRSWSARGHWYDDDSLYSGTKGGRLVLLSNLSPSQSTLHPRVESIFVGREEELKSIEIAFFQKGIGTNNRVICSVQGMPGIGKSYFVEHFYALYKDRFSGGYQRLSLDAIRPGDVEEWLKILAERLKVSAVGHDRDVMLISILTHGPTLVHVENVDSHEAAIVAVGLVNKLGPVPMVVSGRFQGLGVDAGWAQILLNTLSVDDAVEQLNLELGRAISDVDEGRALVLTLGCLPLAVHLAAGYLRKGNSIERFLGKLRDQGFSLFPVDPADYLLQVDHARAILSATFNVSLEILGNQFSKNREYILDAFCCLGYSPMSGFGNKLGAFQSGLKNEDFEDLCVEAVELSLLEKINGFSYLKNGSESRWRLHPLIAEYLRLKIEKSSKGIQVISRITEWFQQNMKKINGVESLWKDVYEESDALIEWLKRVPYDQYIDIGDSAAEYAMHNGPFQVWSDFFERALSMKMDCKRRSRLLGFYSKIVKRAGWLDKALCAAEEKKSLDRSEDDKYGLAVANGLIADVLHAQGDLEGAINIRLTDELPFWREEKDDRMCAMTLRNIADIREDMGDIDEAIRIHLDEEAPLIEGVGDEREIAITKGRVADILTRHPRRGGIDEVKEIREEEIEIYKTHNNMREWAVAKGKLVDILVRKETFDEALYIVDTEIIPTFKKLEDINSIAITQAKRAAIFFGQRKMDAAIRLLEEEVVPVFEGADNLQFLMEAKIQLARARMANEENEKALEILQHEVKPFCISNKYFESLAMAARFEADIYMLKNEIPKAIKVRKEDEIPAYRKLRDYRSLFATLIEVGDMCFDVNGLREAHALYEEAVSVCDIMKNGHLSAIARGRIASILDSVGRVKEALYIRENEEIPIYEELNDEHSIMLCKISMALLYLKINLRKNRGVANKLLCQALAIANASGAEEVCYIEKILHEHRMKCN